jgi:ATP-binding cassette subfamily B (MDR/TAP) protein 1
MVSHAMENDPSKSSHKGNIFRYSKREDLMWGVPALGVSIASALTTPILTILLSVAFNALSQFSTGSYTAKEFMNQVATAVSGILSLGLASVLLSWIMVALWWTFGDRQVFTARSRLFSSLLFKDLAWFDTNTQVMGILAMAHR